MNNETDTTKVEGQPGTEQGTAETDNNQPPWYSGIVSDDRKQMYTQELELLGSGKTEDAVRLLFKRHQDSTAEFNKRATEAGSLRKQNEELQKKLDQTTKIISERQAIGPDFLSLMDDASLEAGQKIARQKYAEFMREGNTEEADKWLNGFDELNKRYTDMKIREEFNKRENDEFIKTHPSEEINKAWNLSLDDEGTQLLLNASKDVSGKMNEKSMRMALMALMGHEQYDAIMMSRGAQRALEDISKSEDKTPDKGVETTGGASDKTVSPPKFEDISAAERVRLYREQQKKLGW